MNDSLREVSAANIPREALTGLAAQRCRSRIEAAIVGDVAWLRWPAGDDSAVVSVLALPRAVLYLQRDGQWFRHGSQLPFFDFPRGLEYRQLHQLIFPEPVRPLAGEKVLEGPRGIALIADHQPRTVTALRCPLEAVRDWADAVPSPRLASLKGVFRADEVFLTGSRLPLLPGGQRYWGATVFVPLGFRLDPNWPEHAIREAAHAQSDDLLVAGARGFEALPRGRLRPLSRYGLRNAAAEES